MTAVTSAHLISQGSPCSLCGNALSSANPPTVSTLSVERFGTNIVEAAICTNPPYVDRHLDNTVDAVDTTYKVLYQYQAATAGNPFAVLEIMVKDLDV